MDRRWAYLVTMVLIVLCVPLMLGAKCNNITNQQPSAEEQLEQVPVPESAEFNANYHEPGTTEGSIGAAYVSKEPMDQVAGFYEKELAGQDDLEIVGHFSPAYVYTNDEGKVVVVRLETQPSGSGYTNIYISVYDQDDYDKLREQVEAEVVPIYPGAMVDSSPDAVMKAESAGGEMYVATDPVDKVRAFYDRELAGMKDFSKQGTSKYTYTDGTGQTVEIFVMQADPEGLTTDILVTRK